MKGMISVEGADRPIRVKVHMCVLGSHETLKGQVLG